MEGVMITYGLASIGAIICCLVCIGSVIISLIRPKTARRYWLSKSLINIASVISVIVFVFTVAVAVAKPSISKTEFGDLIQPISLAIISLVIALCMGKLSQKNKEPDEK
jgi:uncharacterized membrane protein